MIDYILRLLVPAGMAIEAIKKPLEASKNVNQGQDSLNHVQGLKTPYNHWKDFDMKCTCCNKSLSDYEATLRHAETREFLDTCAECLSDIMAYSTLTVLDNPKLLHQGNKEESELDNIEEVW